MATKKLEDLSSRELLSLHNSLAPKPAGPKTFATKSKLLDRIRSLQAAPVETKKATSAKARPPKGKSTGMAGRGVGVLARELLLDPRGYPPTLIATAINNEIEGAACTANSVRWYANEMRKKGVKVPDRARPFPAELTERHSVEWLRTVMLVRHG